MFSTPSTEHTETQVFISLHTNLTGLRQYDCVNNIQIGTALSSIPQPSNTGMLVTMLIPCSCYTSYESAAQYQTLQNNWHWMMRPSGSMQQVQQHHGVAEQNVSLLLLMLRCV
jgi:hypothetical protein